MSVRKQIATFLNDFVIKNEVVDPSTWTTPLAEDLRNYADFGKVLSNLTVAQLEDLKQQMVETHTNELITRTLERKEFGIVRNNAEFRASVQRIVASGEYETLDSHITSLDWNSGNSWHDGKYYGANLDSKLFTKVDTYKVAWSVGDEEYKLSLESADEVIALWTMIEKNVKNTLTKKINALCKRLLCALIDNCMSATTPRKILLVTEFSKEYNPNHTTTPWTMADIKADRDKYSMFKAFVYSITQQTIGYCSESNMIYNDGTVEMFTPKEDIRCVLLNKFANDMAIMTDAIDFHIPKFDVNYDTINAWQTSGKNIVKSLSDISSITVENGETDITYDNIVGVIYDKDAIGITTVVNKTTKEYVGSEGFTTFFAHCGNRFYVDSRFPSVVLVLA